MNDPQPVTFTASDGWVLSGDLFSAPNPRLGVILSSGTGFPRRFYRHLAADLAARGALVLTYDYRGIGGLTSDELSRSAIDLPDWGRFDLAAAITFMESRLNGLPLTHLAHSVGGHILGLAPNHDRISRHAFVSVGTGYFPRHHRGYALLELCFWWGIGPYSLWRHGHLRRGGGWTGEALPPRVFKRWRRWCHHPRYLGRDLDTELAPQHYAAVTAPIRSWIFADDPIATPRTAKDLLALYPSAPSTIHLSQPADFGQRRIGHDGAFRQGLTPLWQDLWHWLSET